MAQGSSIGRRLLVIPPLLIGIAILVWFVRSKPAPLVVQAEETARSVRVIEATPLTLTPVAEGYGSVQPARVWVAVAEVSGRVVSMHPELRDGVILPAGTELLRIDPLDYELAIAQAQAQIAELEAQEANSRASLRIEQRNLELIEREFKRISGLVAQGTVSQSSADATERSVLGVRAQVQSLRNTLALIPAQRRTLDAQLAQSQRNLARTVVRAPFNIRVAALAIESEQFVTTGQKMFEGDSVDRVEILAQFSMSQLRDLLVARPDMNLDFDTLNQRLSELMGLSPSVRLDMGRDFAQWDAEFARMSDTIDPQSRTVGVVVAVDKPFAQAIPGVRPPLTKGMFLNVILRGRAQANRILVPRGAIRDGTLRLVDGDNRLRLRPIELAFEQADFSVIGSGLNDGDMVVVSDLVPVVEGMLLRPQIDTQLSADLRRAAGAQP